MRQFTLELDSNEDDLSTLMLEPQREQQLIALMAQAIVAVVQSPGGEEHEGE